LFLGYSLRDPDIQFLAQLSNHALRRKTPLYAIVSDASDDLCDEWDRKYNIRVVAYRNFDKTHSGLQQILDLVSRYVSLHGEQIPTVPAIPMEAAQSLYTWSRFQSHDAGEARTDAFASLVVTAASQYKQGDAFTILQLVPRVAALGRMSPERIEDAVRLAVQESCNKGYLHQITSNEFSVTTKGTELNAQTASQFAALVNQFEKPFLYSRSISVKPLRCYSVSG
jgi:hypothetical protein